MKVIIKKGNETREIERVSEIEVFTEYGKRIEFLSTTSIKIREVESGH